MLFTPLSGCCVRAESHRDCGKVQDAYTLRCVPQVHGVVWDTVDFVNRVLDTELNSVTDNPVRARFQRVLRCWCSSCSSTVAHSIPYCSLTARRCADHLRWTDGRHDLCRQLPRRVPGEGARLPGDRRARARLHQRAPHRAPRQSGCALYSTVCNVLTAWELFDLFTPGVKHTIDVLLRITFIILYEYLF